MQILHNRRLINVVTPGISGTPILRQCVSGEKGITTKFKFFRFVISRKRFLSDTWNSNGALQFSNLKFFNDGGYQFQYSQNDNDVNILRQQVGMRKYNQDGNDVFTWGDNGNEDGIHGLIGVGNKCLVFTTPNIATSTSEGTLIVNIEYEINKDDKFDNPLLNLSVYKHWSFYTSGDFYERDPINFSIQVTNDRDGMWYEVDRYDEGNITSERDHLAYQGTINLDNLT